MTEKLANILIVVGMHRSGTSVVSQWLGKCSLNIGDNLLGSGIGNEEGHFEDVDFYRYHEDVLQDNHLSKSGYVHQPINNLSYYQEEKLKSITNFKSKIHEQWGWKEPRTCLFLTHYRKLIPDAYYLVVLRDYHAVVNSLIVRDFKHLENKYLARGWFSRLIWRWFRRTRRERKLYKDLSSFYLNIWITYSKELLKHMQSIPMGKFIALNYNLLNSSDKEVFSILKDKWNFSLQYFDFKRVFKEKLISEVIDIDKFIKDKSLLKTAYELECKLKEYI
jgi:hypothetical protein